MTRIQLFLTLSIVICATAPCADGMAAAPPPGPVVSDVLWRGVDDVRTVLAASIDGNVTRIVEWVLAVLVAWRYRARALKALTRVMRERRMASLRTIVGGVPASGVAGGVPPLARPSVATVPRAATETNSCVVPIASGEALVP